MYAVLQWDYNAPFGVEPLIIAENVPHDKAETIANMNPNLYHRQIVTMEELEDMRNPKIERSEDSELSC